MDKSGYCSHNHYYITLATSLKPAVLLISGWPRNRNPVDVCSSSSGISASMWSSRHPLNSPLVLARAEVDESYQTYPKVKWT